MNKRYINRIIKKLKCSSKKRGEIKKQLISEFMAEIENGANSKDIMNRMGTSAEIAEEFNHSFSEEEKKKYKKERWMKIIRIIIFIIIIIAGIVWWILPKQIWIEESKLFDKETVLKQAETVVTYLDADDYDALREISDEAMREILEKSDLKEVKEQIGTDWGAQKSVGNIYTVELTQMWRKSAVVQMHVEYENESVMYTIYFNQDMELEGLWMQ